jgi:thiamine-monophosphate kinase
MRLTAIDDVAENRLLSRWSQLLGRLPEQLNKIHEADAELVPLAGTELLLALTVDTVAEEIALGFYREPETIGWMAATASLSDLAAVAAKPLGLLVSVTLPEGAPQSFQEGVAAGLDAACRAAGTYVLGGDTNVAKEPAITSAAVGVVPQERVLLRTGAGSGELLYASGPLGAGAVPAARAILALPEARWPERSYRPRARVAEAQVLVGFATACMDTSDGLITTLDQLMRLNHIGFELTAPPAGLLEPNARRLSHELGVDPLLLLAQLHGEFELVFTVLEAEQERFEAHAREHEFMPHLLGRTTLEPVIRVTSPRTLELDGTRLRNLWDEVGGDPKRYLAGLAGLVEGKRP